MQRRTTALYSTLMLLLMPGMAASAAPAKGTAATAVVRLRVYPEKVNLVSRRDKRQLVVMAQYADGHMADVTHSVQIDSSNKRAISAAPNTGVVRATADGSAVITVALGGKAVQVPASAAHISADDPVSFKFETMAILTKQGCSTGSCHGSPHGKGGFQLSLFGYDPAADKTALTRDGYNRRINSLEPAESLIIKKPTLQLPHVGGKRLRKEDVGYGLLTRWISEGARTELPAVECTGIRIYPSGEQTLSPVHASQQLSVIASYSDGTERDVTDIAAYDSSSAVSIAVGASGLAQMHGRGQAAISVRYLEHLQSVHFTAVEPVPGFAAHWKEPAQETEIDRLVNERLKTLQYLPSAKCSDAEFLRRVSLDLTGLLPGVERTKAFLADTSAGKRAALVDALLNSEEYARFWALQRADLMRVSPARLKGDRSTKFYNWITDAVRSNLGYDKYAREIITAAGDSEKVPQACYFVAIPGMEERTEMTAELFMGSRVECAHCHNHPFENWTQKDYYRIGAVFARTQERGGVITAAATGEANHPSTGEVMVPFGLAPGMKADPAADRRISFADWLVKPGNPFFARVAVNRIWASLFGRGIVDPIDDFRSSNPASNGGLLDSLAHKFERSGYDSRAMIRDICLSDAYQRSAMPGMFAEKEITLFSRASIRLLTAEQLKDAVAVATGRLASTPQERDRDAYATERAFPENSAFTRAFGQPERTTSCACERQSGPTLIQALELLNGPEFYGMARSGAEKVSALSDDDAIQSIYLAALCRYPTAAEKATGMKFLVKPGDRTEHLTDLYWTVMNTREFLFQH